MRPLLLGVARLRPAVTAFACLLLPSPLLRIVLRVLGHRIGPGARIGFSLLWCHCLCLDAHTRIGHLNLVRAHRVFLRRGAYVGRMNVLHGPFSILLRQDASIGNSNKVLRAPMGSVTVGPSMLRLGRLSKITAEHRVDVTSTVWMGDYSVLAGSGSQVWSHGYMHDHQGPGRYRIDGAVRIGNNVYIGARCLLSMGVRISDGAIVGAGTTVARNLTEPGLYVSATMRQLPRPPLPEQRSDLQRVHGEHLVETVYRKRAEVRSVL
jgi:acetyltransferase-like isoleucine patch superfamily enzyme